MNRIIDDLKIYDIPDDFEEVVYRHDRSNVGHPLAWIKIARHQYSNYDELRIRVAGWNGPEHMKRKIKDALKVLATRKIADALREWSIVREMRGFPGVPRIDELEIWIDEAD